MDIGIILCIVFIFIISLTSLIFSIISFTRNNNSVDCNLVKRVDYMNRVLEKLVIGYKL